MRVTSDEKLARASELRRDGKSWLQLSKTAKGKDAGLEFFRTGSSGKASKNSKKVAA